MIVTFWNGINATSRPSEDANGRYDFFFFKNNELFKQIKSLENNGLEIS